MTAADWASLVLQLGLGSGFGLAVLAYFRERRKNRAEGLEAESLAEVAHETVLTEVARVGIGALEAQVVAMERAWSLERASTERRLAAAEATVAALAGENEKLRADRDRKDEMIADLRARVERLESEAAELKRLIDEAGRT